MNWKLSFILLTLSVMACGMPVSTLSPESVSKEVHIITPSLDPAPTPLRSDAESTARACGSLWVREGAGIEYPKIAWALRGDTLTLTGKEREAKDGGQWSQVIDRDGLTGWVNTRFICGGEK